MLKKCIKKQIFKTQVHGKNTSYILSIYKINERK